MDIKKTDREYLANTYKKFDVVLSRAEGFFLYDENAKEYIDMGSGIAVNTFGADDEEWKNAVIAQLGTLKHTSNLYYTEPCAYLAKLLCEKTGMKKAFFSNSGAEANECAIKTARKYSSDQYKDKIGRYKIITLKDSFHGRTIATLSATGQDIFHKDFYPFLEGFVYVEAGDIASMKRHIESGECCAVMLEVIQGESGVVVLDEDFVKETARIASENDVLFIIDEVQSGNGRTGRMYAYEHFGIAPDIVTTAKGLGGGLPIGCTLFGQKTKDVLSQGDHGSTFGGNPICAAGAVSIVERLTRELFDEVGEKGEYIINELKRAKGVKSVSGMGLMIGIEPEKPASEIVNALIGRGVLVLTAKDKIRLLPPLNIPFELVEKAVSIIKEELSK